MGGPNRVQCLSLGVSKRRDVEVFGSLPNTSIAAEIVDIVELTVKRSVAIRGFTMTGVALQRREK